MVCYFLHAVKQEWDTYNYNIEMALHRKKVVQPHSQAQKYVSWGGSMSSGWIWALELEGDSLSPIATECEMATSCCRDSSLFLDNCRCTFEPSHSSGGAALHAHSFHAVILDA